MKPPVHLVLLGQGSPNIERMMKVANCEREIVSVGQNVVGVHPPVICHKFMTLM